jgi:uncharacterized membrane protein YccC
MTEKEKEKRLKKRSKFKAFIPLLVKQIQAAVSRLDIKMAIKVTVAALLSLYLCLEINTYLKHPVYIAPGLWCVVSAVIVLQANIGATYKSIWDRVVGVFIGSAIGALAAFYFGPGAIVLAVAFFFTIILCSLLGIPESYRMASLSVAIIMIPWQLHSSVDPWIGAFFRFLDTCLGFIPAILVTHLFWPSEALVKMRLSMSELLNLFHQWFEHLSIPVDSAYQRDRMLQILSTEIDQAFSQIQARVEESKVELLLHFASVTAWTNLINCQNRLWESLSVLRTVFDKNLDEIFDQGLRQQVHHAMEVIDFALKELSIKLKTGQTNFDFDLLNQLQVSLQRELIRFRSTHKIKQYDLNRVEDYFVFFYQLKQISTTLYQFNELLEHLREKKKILFGPIKEKP